MLVLRRGQHGPIMAGPSYGALIDVSLCGAGLAVEQIRIDNCHLFYSPQDNSAQILHLEVSLSLEEGGEVLSIPVRPVRFDRFLDEEAVAKPFHVGVEFLPGPGDEHVCRLYELVAEQNRRKGWWRRLLDMILSVD